MPAPIPLPIRQALWRRHQSGATTRQLSQAFGLAPRAVPHLPRRGRERAEAGLTTAYRRLPDPPPMPEHSAFAPAALLRREHPGWGAGLIRIDLEDQGVRPLPSTAPSSNGSAAPGRARRRRGVARRPPPAAPPPPTRSGRSTPPRRWPRPTGPGSRGCGSPTSSAARCCRPRFSPLGRWNGVPAAFTQQRLRAAFARRGLPRALRVDDGTPWGSAGDLPTDLALWPSGWARR